MISNPETKSSKELKKHFFNIFQDTVHEITDLAERAPNQIVESVHLIRKRLKFLRAFVKLTQFCDNDQQYKPINYILRDCGRTVSECRDAHVREILLTERAQNASTGSLTEELTALNNASIKDIENGLLSDTTVFDELVAQISGKKIKKYFKSLKPDADCLVLGYTLGYERGYHAFHSELKSHEADLLHEWRKRTKDLQYQQEVLRGSIPHELSPSYEEVSALCEILGRINDIFMFLEWLGLVKNEVQTKDQFPALKNQLEEELNELENKADEMGHSLFVTSPDMYARELKKDVES